MSRKEELVQYLTWLEKNQAKISRRQLLKAGAYGLTAWPGEEDD